MNEISPQGLSAVPQPSPEGQFTKRTLLHVNLIGKTVLMRVDFNVPLRNGSIEDNYRILQSIPTITYIIESGASLILMSHLGRPEGEADPKYSLKPVAKELSKLLGKRIKMASTVVGEDVRKAVRELKRGSILFLENVRFHPGETSKDDDIRGDFARKLAGLADIYVNDAFAVSHREHASTATVARLIPSYAGLLVEREIAAFEHILRTPPRPMMVILGGIKIETKIPLIRNLLPRSDRLLIGGGMAYYFLKASNLEVGQFPLDEDHVRQAGQFLRESDGKIELPTDVVAGKIDMATRKPVGSLQVYSREKIPADKEGYDIGPQTLRKWSNTLSSAKSILWNGPVGFFECEETRKGTETIAKMLAHLTEKGVLTIVGGGDSAAAVRQAGLMDKIKHLSTGGGAALMYLEGRPLPGLASLAERL